MCGTMLRPPESRGEYPQYYYQPTPFYPTPIPADPQLIKDAVNLLILYRNQLDWVTFDNLLDALSKLCLLGEGAYAAARYLREWVRARKRQRASETEP
jgi:hypothetical protein